jgi:hypothetical protein
MAVARGVPSPHQTADRTPAALVLAGRPMLSPRAMSSETKTILSAARSAVTEALAAARKVTRDGKDIDDHQVHAGRVAYAATELAAAEALAAYAADRRAAGQGDDTSDLMAAAFAGEIAAKLRAMIEAHEDDFGIAPRALDETLRAPAVRAAIRRRSTRSASAGSARWIHTRGANNGYIDGDIAEMARDPLASSPARTWRRSPSASTATTSSSPNRSSAPCA